MQLPWGNTTVDSTSNLICMFMNEPGRDDRLGVCCVAMRPQVVVLSPAIVVRNWEAEFKKFVPGRLADVLNVVVLDAGTVRILPKKLWFAFSLCR